MFNTDTMTRKGTYQGKFFATESKAALVELATEAALADFPDFERATRIRALVRESQPAYVAGLALHLRQRYLGKTLPFLLTAELARWRSGLLGLDSVLDEVIEHSGEIPDWLALFEAARGGAWPSRGPRFLRKVLGKVFGRLDALQLSQCSPEEQARLRQALLYIRPRAVDEEQVALFEQMRRNYWAPYRMRPALRVVADLIETDLK